MRYLWQHLEQILKQYHGELPLHHFLKGYFKKYPKLGSRDRRGLGDAVYAWYRAGKAFAADEHEAENLRLAAMYLCGTKPKAFASFFPEEWTEFTAGIQDRINLLQQRGFSLRPEQIFPNDVPFSAGITADEWRLSLLRQPRLFLRIRKGRDEIATRLQAASIPYEWLSDTCLAIPNGTKMERLLPDDCYVVQDASSQATGRYLQAFPDERWWDCCSGAGGKSLLLKDASPDVKLLATDVRQSILNNLKDRFRLYHHTLTEMATLDVSDEMATARFLGDRLFDGIICDVPCTGSGTWARTPESCYFFNPATVADYAKRQQAILRNACDFLKEDGRIIYITCSVFRAENEAVIESIAGEGRMRIVSAGLINGLSIGADALFAAELRPA
jgi:16S rRNA (cytosine967-C5)-methyltransferase